MFTKIKIATSKFFVVIILVEPYDYEKQLKIVLRGKVGANSVLRYNELVV